MKLKIKTKILCSILEVETETINRDLEKQFNESLQSKITHTHHIGLGFHGDNTSASSSNDWQHQLPKTKFVPAKTETGAAMDHVKVEEQLNDKKDKTTKSSTENTNDKVDDKKEKKKHSSTEDVNEKVDDKKEKKKRSSTEIVDGKVDDKSSDKQEKKKKSKA